MGLTGPVQHLEQRAHRRSDPGLDAIRDFESFDAEFGRTGKLLSYTSYLHSGKIHERTSYFYDDSDEQVLTVECDAVGRCKAISDRRTEGYGQWVYRTTRTPKGIVTATTVEHYRSGSLISIWNCDAERRTKREKHFQYAGNKLFKSVSLYHAAGRIVERWVTSCDSEGRISKTFGLTEAGSPLGDGKYVYEYDEEGRKRYVWSFDDLSPRDSANALNIYEYDCDAHGNWIERRRFHQFRGDSSWRLTKTIRRIEYSS